jgi:hypothetical protein
MVHQIIYDSLHEVQKTLQGYYFKFIIEEDKVAFK